MSDMKKVTIRLSPEEHQKLGDQGTPTQIVTDLVRGHLIEDLRPGATVNGETSPIDQAFFISFENRIIEALARTERATNQLESTASFRQLTRDEVFSLAKTAAQYGPEIEEANLKIKEQMEGFVGEMGKSLEVLERVEKSIHRMAAAGDRYENILQQIEGMKDRTATQMRGLDDGLSAMHRDIKAQSVRVIKELTQDVEEQGRKLFLYGGGFVACCLLGLFVLHYFGVFYPDADWLREALLGKGR